MAGKKQEIQPKSAFLLWYQKDIVQRESIGLDVLWVGYHMARG